MNKNVLKKNICFILTTIMLLSGISSISIAAISPTPIITAEEAHVAVLKPDGGGSDDGALPTHHEPRYAKDRVLVKLRNITPSQSGGMAAYSLDRMSSPSDLGVEFSEMRLLNPSKETASPASDGFQSYSMQSNNDYQGNVFVLTLENDTVEHALDVLNANPAVEIAEPDYLRKIFATPNDPMYNTQYALERINVEQAWNITTGCENVVVGVIDTGIDGTHPDLMDNLWINPNPNQNGYVDDIHGYNFSGKTGGIPTDVHGHGTQVAGIIGAKGNNELGVSGVNWDISLAWMGTHESGNELSDSAIIEAINYAGNYDIPITNNSYGGSDYSELLYQAISNYNGLFVAAAGNEYVSNDYYPHYPASYDLPNIISVAATNRQDALESYSNTGAESVHIAAPGNSVLSTSTGGGFSNINGTSAACPHVAGTAALIKTLRPEYEPWQIRDLIHGTARHVSTLSMEGFGVLNAYSAVSTKFDDLINVTWDYNDGVRTPVTKVTPGNRVSGRGRPERNGYIFSGWYTSAVGGSAFNFLNPINYDTTIYARWTEALPGMYIMEFPDSIFRREVLKLLNKQFGGNRTDSSMIGPDEAARLGSIKELNIVGKGILDMTGISYFTGITEFSCAGNRLAELDLSKNTELTLIYCNVNRMTELDLSKNTKLKHLQCIDNQLTKLILPDSNAFTHLYCYENQLAELDTSKNTALQVLYCDNNRLAKLDLSKNTALSAIMCNGNKLTELDLSKNTSLSSLLCNANQLTGLDLSNNTELWTVSCTDNQLTELDISKNNEVIELTCSMNNMKSTDDVKGWRETKINLGLNFIFYPQKEIPPFTNAALPIITGQSMNKQANFGDTVELTVEAHVSKGNLSYQWFIGPTGDGVFIEDANHDDGIKPLSDGTGYKAINGATDAVYYALANKNGATPYYCEVTNTDNTATGIKEAVVASKVVFIIVYASHTYSAIIEPGGTHNYAPATVGYSNTEMEQQFTITSTGIQPLTGLTATLYSADYEISESNLEGILWAWDTATVSVRPKNGLAADTYTGTLTITGDNPVHLEVNLSFKVYPAGAPFIMINTPPEDDGVMVTLTRPLDGDEILIIAVFDGSKLLNMKVTTKEAVPQDGNTYFVEIPIDANAKSIKAMWWNEMNTMQPLCDTETVVYDGNRWKLIAN